MKKPKVNLVTLSQKLDDGSRNTLSTKNICTCNERGTAEVICKLLSEETYKSLLEEKSDDKQIYLLLVEY